MLKTLNIKKDLSFTIIFQTLKVAQKRLASYPWYPSFKTILSDVEALSKAERKGTAVSQEDRAAIFERMSKLEMQTQAIDLSGEKIDFYELKARLKKDQVAKDVKYLENLADTITAMNALKEEGLPHCNKKQGFGVKKAAGILFFTNVPNRIEISQTFEKAYQVYPGWVAESVPVAVIHEDCTKEEAEIRKKQVESLFENLICVGAQTRGKYKYYALLPANHKLSLSKVYVLGKATISDRKIAKKGLDHREELKRVMASVAEELQVVDRCVRSINIQLDNIKEKKAALESSLSSPTVKATDTIAKLAELEKQNEQVKKALDNANKDKKRLEEKRDAIIEEAKQYI